MGRPATSATPTPSRPPANQEKVAAGKFTSLYKSLGSWRRVAYWWLTGSKRTSGWSDYATRYVNRVMRLYKKSGGGLQRRRRPPATWQALQRAARAWPRLQRLVADRPGTRLRRRQGPLRDQGRRHARRSRSPARGDRLYGPLGPTRGKAKVYLDGTYVKTVDLYRGVFDARAKVFQSGWKAGRQHR